VPCFPVDLGKGAFFTGRLLSIMELIVGSLRNTYSAFLAKSLSIELSKKTAEFDNEVKRINSTFFGNKKFYMATSRFRQGLSPPRRKFWSLLIS